MLSVNSDTCENGVMTDIGIIYQMVALLFRMESSKHIFVKDTLKSERTSTHVKNDIYLLK